MTLYNNLNNLKLEGKIVQPQIPHKHWSLKQSNTTAQVVNCLLLVMCSSHEKCS